MQTKLTTNNRTLDFQVSNCSQFGEFVEMLKENVINTLVVSGPPACGKTTDMMVTLSHYGMNWRKVTGYLRAQKFFEILAATKENEVLLLDDVSIDLQECYVFDIQSGSCWSWERRFC